MTFDEFYREEYLGAHTSPACRLFHALGPPVTAVLAGVVIWLEAWWFLLLLPLPMYLLAWLGHVVAGNKPTFFGHPWWSFLGYWKMIGSMYSGQIGWAETHPENKA